MKILSIIKNKVFKKKILSINEFVKKHLMDDMTEDQMESKLVKIIYSNSLIPRYSKKEKEIAMLLIGNHIQDKDRKNMKLEYYKAMSIFENKQKELSS